MERENVFTIHWSDSLFCSCIHRASKGGQEAKQPAKMKALNGTILRLTESNQRLQSENKLLKQDLDRALDEGTPDMTQGGKKRKGKKKDYEDMNRRELLASIADLEEVSNLIHAREFSGFSWNFRKFND